MFMFIAVRVFISFTFARRMKIFWRFRSKPTRNSVAVEFYFLFAYVYSRCKVSCFIIKPVVTVRICQHLAQPPSWRTTPCRLSATAYSIYSQLPSILEAVPPTATWGRAMPWWQEPTSGGETWGEKDHLGYPGLDGKIILRWIFRK